MLHMWWENKDSLCYLRLILTLSNGLFGAFLKPTFEMSLKIWAFGNYAASFLRSFPPAKIMAIIGMSTIDSAPVLGYVATFELGSLLFSF